MLVDALHRGGKERRLLELIKELKVEQVECEVVVFSNIIEYDEFVKIDVKIHIIKRKINKDPTAFFELYRMCKKFRPTVLHSWEAMATVYSVPIALVLGIPLINAMIVDAPRTLGLFSRRWVRSKITFPFSKIILANSEAGLLAYNAPNNKSKYIYNGFDFTRLDNLVSEDHIRKQHNLKFKNIVGMVAAFSKYKDYRTYLKAAQIVLEKNDDVCFVCVGNGKELKVIKESVASRLKERIFYLGVQSRVEAIVNVFSIGVLSTYTEGISNSIMEYMALGKPVVATDGGGTKELVLDGKTGFLVKPQSPQALAEKILLLLDNETLAIKMGNEGRDRIRDKFSLKKMTQKYIRLYHDLTNPKNDKRILVKA